MHRRGGIRSFPKKIYILLSRHTIIGQNKKYYCSNFFISLKKLFKNFSLKNHFFMLRPFAQPETPKAQYGVKKQLHIKIRHQYQHSGVTGFVPSTVLVCKQDIYKPLHPPSPFPLTLLGRIESSWVILRVQKVLILSALSFTLFELMLLLNGLFQSSRIGSVVSPTD